MKAKERTKWLSSKTPPHFAGTVRRLKRTCVTKRTFVVNPAKLASTNGQTCKRCSKQLDAVLCFVRELCKEIQGRNFLEVTFKSYL